MDKPKLNYPVEKCYDYQEFQEYMEHVTGRKLRDWAGSHGHFRMWCKDNDLVHDHKDIKKHQKIYAQYKAAPDGDASCPPYQDFWHWFIAMDGDMIHNGSFITLYLDDQEDAPHWVLDILEAIAKEFDDEIPLWVEW